VFDVCPRCGEYSAEKIIDPSGPFAICPQCGYRHQFVRLPLFVVTGSSATGKTSVALQLTATMRDYVCLDGDVLWRREYDRPQDDYRTFRNLCLRVAKSIGQAGRPVVLMAGGIPDQFEACPERRYFSELHYLALVCDDAELVNRLTARPRWRMSASPQRMARERSFNRWLVENATKTVPAIRLLDTSRITEEDAARQVDTWVRSAPGNR
jgi:hypothetical protein